MTRAQTLFAVALTVIAALVLVVGAYVLSSTRWGDRWYSRRRRP